MSIPWLPKSSRLALAAALVTITLSGVSLAQSTPTRTIDIRLDKRISVSFSYRDVFTKEIVKKLDSGLPTRIVIQTNIEQKGKNRPLAYWVRSADIVYDLWEEVYLITLEDDLGKRRARTKSRQEAIGVASTISNSEIARSKGLGTGSFRVRVSVEVNPVSKEMVEHIRRWLARPRATEGGSLAPTNFFGSFVGVFVDRRIGQADKSITFVSQWFSLSEP